MTVFELAALLADSHVFVTGALEIGYIATGAYIAGEFTIRPETRHAAAQDPAVFSI